MSFHPNDIARRSRGARVLLIGSFVWLLGGFYRTQVLHHAQYVLQSEENRLREVPLPAPRGIIYDRGGRVIAENLPGYTVSVLSPSPDSLRTTLKRLNAVIPYSDDDIETAVRRFNRAPNRPAVILADATFPQVSVLEEHRTEFPNLIIQSTPKRWYPDGPAVAGFIGYTGEISEAELANPRYKGYKAGMRIGKRGLEQQYEDNLRGREGYRYVEVDARGRVVREAGAREDRQPEAAPALYTNIDMDLQRFTATLFGDTLQGAAVTLDPATGGVLALYSAPSYDPNRFTGGIPKSYWDSLNTDPRRPMYNKAVQGRYAPGSTFKLATAIAGLQEGIVNLDSHMDVPCTGGFSFGRGYWRCWEKRGHGNLNLAQAIEKSCDVYFYQLGLKLQLTRLVAGGVKMHFNEKTGIDLPSETRPDFPYAIDYFRKKYGRNYVAASTAINMSIGQGDNAQTVINMAKFYVALANDGVAARPTIARIPSAKERLYSLTPQQLDGIRTALAGVVSSRGTAAGAVIQGVVIAGKTGTAQSGNYDKLTGKELNHAWFTGFAPAESPRIVVAVMLENVPFHGSVTARLASAMIGHYLKQRADVTEAVTNGG